MAESRLALLAGGVRKISPFFVPGSIINLISGQLSIMYGLKGPNIATFGRAIVVPFQGDNSASRSPPRAALRLPWADLFGPFGALPATTAPPHFRTLELSMSWGKYMPIGG